MVKGFCPVLMHYLTHVLSHAVLLRSDGRREAVIDKLDCA